MHIYKYHIEVTLPGLEKRIKEANYSAINKNAILDFENFLYAGGMKQLGILKRISCLNIIAQTAKKDFIDMDRTDVQEIVANIERSKRAEKTKVHYRLALRSLLRYLQGEQNAASWIKTAQRISDRKLPEGLLTEAEVKKMIEVANHPRDKALVACLYDSGCRIGEIGTLQIKNVVFDQYGAVLNVHGKTGSRRVRIMFSSSYIAAWLDIHPSKANGEAFVFTKIKGESKDPMEHSALLHIVHRLAENAGIQKRVHPHLFRHSRATELANHLTESQMNSHLGWVPGSGMSGVYVHLSGRDTDNAILEMYGKKKLEDSIPELNSITCPRCEKENGPTSKFCARCGMPLDEKMALDLQEKKNKLPELLNLIMSSEEGRKLFFEIQKEMGQK